MTHLVLHLVETTWLSLRDDVVTVSIADRWWVLAVLVVFAPVGPPDVLAHTHFLPTHEGQKHSRLRVSVLLVSEGSGRNSDAVHGTHKLLGPGRRAQVRAVGFFLGIVDGVMEDDGARTLLHRRQAASCLQIVRTECRSGIVQDREIIGQFQVPLGRVQTQSLKQPLSQITHRVRVENVHIKGIIFERANGQCQWHGHGWPGKGRR